MVFYLALLPTILDLTRITVLGYAELVAATLSVLALVFAGYIALAARARRLFTSPKAIRILNRATGAHGRARPPRHPAARLIRAPAFRSNARISRIRKGFPAPRRRAGGYMMKFKRDHLNN